MSKERVIVLTLSLKDAILLQKMVLSSRVDKSEEEQAYEILVRLQAAFN